MASGFAEAVRDKIEPGNSSSKNLTWELRETKPDYFLSEQLNPRLTYQQIQADAQLLKHCLQTAQAELGNIESNQEAIASWAIFLYCQAKQEL